MLLIQFCYVEAVSDEFYPLKFNTENYPDISIDGILESHDNVVNITQSNLILTENGEQRSINNVQCSNLNPSKRDINLLIVIDFSSSMSGRNFNLIKLVLSDFLRNFNFANSRIAISGFSNINFLIHDFSNSSLSLANSLENLQHFGSSDLEYALINNPASATNIFKSVSGIKEAILISDGSEIGNLGAIRDSLKSMDIRLSSLTLDFPASSIVSSLTKQLGGYSIGSIENFDEFAKSFKSLIYLAEFNSVCQISYNSFTCSQQNKVNLNFTDLGMSRNLNYLLPYSKTPSLKVEPSFFDFGMRLPPSKPKQKFLITALNSDIDILGFDDNSIFKVISEPKSFKLKQGETREIEVEFEPIDSSYVFKEINILGNQCQGSFISLAGGSDHTIIIDKTIKVTKPNGGEYLQVGTATQIEWSGTLPSDTVKIDYSINNGDTWINITNNATGLKYNWSIVPNTISNNCLVKISQLSKYDLSKNIISLKGVQGNVVNIVWRNELNELYTGSTDGFIRLWNASNGEPTKTIKGGIINLYDFDISPDFKYVAYISQNSSTLTILNTENEFDIRNIDFQDDILVKLDWNPINNFLAVATQSGKVYILDYPDEVPVKTYDNTEIVSFLEWSQNGQRLAIAYNNGICDVNSIESGEIVTIKASDQRVNSVAFNPTGNFLITASMNEFIRVWDINNTTNITSFNNIRKPVNAVAWDPTALFVASASVDSAIALWNPGSGNVHYTFRGHNNKVNKIRWRSDGKRIASSTNQGEVFIWSPDDIPFTRPTLQIDTSDKLWSIVNPQIQLKPVVFAPIRVNDSMDSTVFALLTNANNYDIFIDTFFVKSSNSPFSISSVLPDFPLLIKAQTSIDLQLRFNPKSVGARIDTIVFLSGFREFRTSLFGFSTERIIEITPDYHNFGIQKIGNNSDIFTIEVANISDNSVFIEDILPLINDENQFNLIDFKSGFVDPGESKFFDIIFSPSKFFTSSALFDVIYDGKSGPDYISMIGSGAAPQISFQRNINLPEIVCENTFEEIIKIYNIGNEKLKINSITLSEDSPKDFSLELSSTEFNLSETDSTYITLRYSGTEPGNFSFQIVINSEINADKSTVNNIEVLFRRGVSEYKLYPPNLAYYVFETNTSGNKELKIINTGTESVEWTLPNFTDYFVVDSILPKTTMPGDTSLATIRFIGANDEGFYSDKLTFSDSCGNESILSVSAYVGPSDAVLTSADLIVFPEVFCIADTSEQKFSIANNGTTPLVISSMEFKLGTDNFFIISENEAISIEAGKQMEVQLGFYPTKSGFSYDSLIIHTNAKNYSDGIFVAYISAFYGKTDFTISDELIELDGLLPNEPASSFFSLSNNGSIPIQWDIVDKYDYFTIDSINPEITLPGDISKVYFTFKGGNQGVTYSQVFRFNTLCNNPDSLEIRAIVDGNASVIIKVGTANAKPGDSLEIPIYILASGQNELPDVSAYNVTISFNSTLLVPLTDYNTFVKGEMRFIDLILPANPLNHDIPVMNLNFLATLGNQDSTEIIINSSKAENNAQIKILEIDGLFSLDGLSYDGGVRLIGNSGLLKLGQNYPNPVTNTSKIIFSVIETGVHSIAIYDLLGNPVKTIFSNAIIPGKYEVEFSLDELPIGNYVYKLNTPTTSLTRKMTINR